MIQLDTPETQNALKEALSDALRENRDWFRELVQEALLDMATAEARLEADLRASHAEITHTTGIPHGQA